MSEFYLDLLDLLNNSKAFSRLIDAWFNRVRVLGRWQDQTDQYTVI